jgi:hypothetical protein
MARLCDLKKYIVGKNPTRTQKSSTTNSEYFFFGGRCVRISDHNNTNKQFSPTSLNIIVPSNSKDNYIVNLNYNAITLCYKDVKKFIDAYIWGITTIFTVDSVQKAPESPEMRELNEELRKSISSLVSRWGLIASEYNKNKVSCEEAFKANYTLNTKIKMQNKCIKDLKSEIDKLKNELDTYITVSKELTSEKSDLEQELELLKSEKLDLEQRIERLADKISNLITDL